MENKLLPCPFCGGKAECKTHYVYGKSRGHFVYCTKCQITQDKLYVTKQYAIKKWNKRVDKETAEKLLRGFANAFPKIKGISSSHAKINTYIEERAKEFNIEIKG